MRAGKGAGWRQKDRRQGRGAKDKKKSEKVRPGKSQVETELSPDEAGGGGQAPVMETHPPPPTQSPAFSAWRWPQSPGHTPRSRGPPAAPPLQAQSDPYLVRATAFWSAGLVPPFPVGPFSPGQGNHLHAQW